MSYVKHGTIVRTVCMVNENEERYSELASLADSSSQRNNISQKSLWRWLWRPLNLRNGEKENALGSRGELALRDASLSPWQSSFERSGLRAGRRDFEMYKLSTFT